MKETKIAHIKYDENATIQLPSYLYTSTPIIYAELFLEFLKEKRPSCVEQVVERAVVRLRNLDEEDTDGVEFAYERDNLREYPELEETMKRVTLGILNYTKYEAKLRNEMATLPRRAYREPLLHIGYALAASLAEVVPRREALALFRQSVDFSIDRLGAIVAPPTQDLKMLYERHQAAATGDIETRSILLDEGRLVGRVDRCMPQEILDVYGDPEVASVVICHSHFHQAEVANPNFVLTRTKTLVCSDSYCDFCWHDKRFDTSLKHPPEEVFQNLASQ